VLDDMANEEISQYLKTAVVLRDRLEEDEVLLRGQGLRSKNGRVLLFLEEDGNLVLSRAADSRVLWASGTAGKQGVRLIMQRDSNLVLYRNDGKPVWSTGTVGQKSTFNKDSVAILQDDGNFVVYDRIVFYKSEPGAGSHQETTKKALWDTGVAGSILAAQDMEAMYQKLGGPYGSLGNPLGGMQSMPNGKYLRKFELGEMHTLEGEVPIPRTYFEVTPRIAAIKCFGTDDPSGTDELYAVVSLIRLDPAYKGEDELVKTTVLPPQKVQAGQVFAESSAIGVARPAGTGVKIHVALFDQEHGDYETVRKEIEEQLRELVKAGIAAIAGGDLSLVSGAPGVLDNKVTKFLTANLSGEIAKWFADDLIDQKVFELNSGDVLKWANPETLKASYMTSNDLPSNIQFNLPRDQYAMHWLFTNGHGSYKVYLQVRVAENPIVIEPPHV
jgi:hypothetical protein